MLNDIDMRDHTYDLDLLAAPMHNLLAYRKLDEVMGTPAMGRVLGRIEAIRASLELRSANLHSALLIRPDGASLCSCGLVIPEDLEPEDALGHLDLIKWRGAGVYVVVTREGRYAAACQCGWRRVCEELESARADEAAHRDGHGW